MNRYTVLIAGAEDEDRVPLVTRLQDAGFRTFSAVTEAETLQKIPAEKPTFVLLDFGHQEQLAFNLLDKLRKNPPAERMVLIVLSSRPDVDHKLRYLKGGAHDVLVKPVEPREVAARLERFLEMIQEFRAFSPAPESPRLLVPGPGDKDKSQASVDLGTSSGDSVARIKPRYGDYRVDQLVGSGGMGYVFKAYEESLDRFVAIKILSRRLSRSPSFVQRFRHEAKVLASLNHPGIAFIYTFGEQDGDHYFAMQWCPGGSLADMVRKKGRLELLPSVEIMLSCALALQAAAAKGVVHRDIKPSNLLFDEEQHIKLVDFGLALGEKTSSRITQSQEFLGTPAFMAPEQAQSPDVDHRADIYSLGITFYYMLYGKYPFEAASAIEMLIKHATEPFPAFDSLNGRIPARAHQIISRMTRKSPTDRYPDYDSLIVDFEDLRNETLRRSQWKFPRLTARSPIPPFHSSNILDMLSSLYSQSASGVLRVRRGQLARSFLVRQQELILFESNQPEDDVWQELGRRNLVAPANFAAQSAQELETTLNEAFLKNQLAPDDFKAAYLAILRAAILQFSGWTDLSCEFHYGTIEHDPFVSLRLDQVILEAARTRVTPDELQARVPEDAFLIRTEQFDTILAGLDLKPEESFLAYRIEGSETMLQTLVLLTGMPEEKIRRLAFALERMSAIQYQAAAAKKSRRIAQPQPASAPLAGAQRAPVEEKEFTAASALPDLSQTRSPEVEHQIRMAEQFYRMALEKFQELDYWKAAEFCKQAIRHAPRQARYYHLMARSYAHHPRFVKDAEQCFYKAIETDPWNPEYHVDLARFYLLQNLPARALAQCEKALKLHPDHPGGTQLLNEIAQRK